VLTFADVAIKSPNDGLPPYELDRVLGRALVRPLQEDENITFADLKATSG
jgi:N-acetylneuraminate synthase/sialic acid synthase